MKKVLSVLLSLLLVLTVFSGSYSNAVQAQKLAGSDAVSLDIAQEGMVLLKNDNSCLPFTSNMKIGLYGKGQSEEYVVGGGGSGWVNTDVIVTPLDGLQRAVSEGKIKSVTTMNSPTQAGFDRVVYFVYRGSTEGDDRKAVEGDYYLSAEEKNDISALVSAYPGRVTVVLNVAGIVDTTWLVNSGISGMILIWLAGGMGGVALANILTGQVSPSGKLVDTWAKDYNDYLSSATFADKIDVNYYEDIFVGYRQFETFDPTYQKVNFEFGYGLSYTNFQITTNSVNVSDGNVNFSITVKNIGTKYSGKEVVQVYYSAPNATLGNPAKELGAFAKTKLLAPGESQTLSVSFAVNDMASYDDTGKIKKSAWVLEKGQYKFYVGNSIKNAGQKGVAGVYNVNSNVIVEECTEYGTTIDKRLLSNGTYEQFVSANSGSKGVHNVSPYGYTYISAVDYSDIYKEAIEETHYHGTVLHTYLNNMAQAGSYVTYTLDVERAGDYYLSLSACDWNIRNDYCTVYVNGVKQSAKYNSDAGIFTPFILSAPAKIYLPKGKVELKLTMNNVSLLSHMYISTSNVSPSGNTVIQAEAASSANERLCIADAFKVSAGKTATYTLYAEKAGTYYLSLDYTNTSDATGNAIGLKVNGSSKGSFGLSKTGFDTSFACASENIRFVQSGSIAVSLNAGNNAIVLTANKELAAYVDSITVSTSDNGIKFKDNTKDFVVPDLSGKILSEPINFDALYNSLNDTDTANDLLDEFISQLSIKDMACMSSLYGRLDATGTGTGSYGVVDSDQLYYSEKYGLFAVSTADGPAGIRSVVGECFTYMPCTSLLASTWNTELIYTFGVTIGKEAASVGVNVWLAPGANIHRNPLCGRNFEYISEDPYLTGIVASQIISGCQSQGVGCSLKHFAANNKEHNRHNSNSVLSERALREIYIKGFEIAIKRSNPVTVMTSYNVINGVPAECDKTLLVEIARGEWGYDGLFISDWYNNTSHPVAMANGNNLVDDNPNPDEVVRAYISGYLTRDVLEENTKYILKSMVKVYRAKPVSILEGCAPVNLGESFYAHIKQSFTGLYLTSKDNNVCASEGVFDPSQTFHFVRRANGAYTIICDTNGYCFDIEGGVYSDGTNIQMYENNGSYAQQFYIYYIEGNFYFKTATGNKILDVDAATRNAQIWGNDTGIGVDLTALGARSFEIYKINLDHFNWNMNLGTNYSCFIKNAATGLLLTAEGDNAIFRKATYSDNQKWIVTRNEYGGHTLQSAATGKVLDVSSASMEHGTDINLWESNGTKAQNFFFIDAGNSKVYIKPSYTNTVVDMDANNLEIHSCMYGTTKVHTDAQLFQLITDPLKDSLIIKSGSSYSVKSGCLVNVKSGTTVADVISAFENSNVVVVNQQGEIVQNGALSCTGYRVNLVENGVVKDSLEIAVAGDVDGSGKLDSTDYLRIKGMFLGSYKLEGAYFIAGDVDNSGIIDSTDYLRLKGAFLGNFVL